MRALLVTVMGGLCAISAAAQTFDNAAVIALHSAGLGEQPIVAKIGSLPCAYDVSANALIALKRANLPDGVITAMVARCGSSMRAQGVAASNDPAAAHRPGIYLMRDWAGTPEMQLVRPSKGGGVKVTGNGSILLPFVSRLTIPDPSSRTVVKTKSPVFYFYFAPGDVNVSDFGAEDSVSAQSPSEYTLVSLKVKNSAREIAVGKITPFGGRAGVDPKSGIKFATTEINDGAFKVTLGQPLAAGEYAFVITGANNAARIYDFTVE